MTRLPALAALLTLAAAPGIAAAQTQDCIANGLLTIDSIATGTQRVPRDPRSGRDLLTIRAGVRNLSTGQVTFTASCSGRMAQDFVTGQSWTLPPASGPFRDRQCVQARPVRRDRAELA